MKLFTYNLVILGLIWLSVPSEVLAQNNQFVPLIGIPGLAATGYTIGGYINILYVLAISIAAFLVVVRLMLAGFKYMLTDVVPAKESAKAEIKNALIGLLIVIGAVLVLNTINPQLTNLNVLNLRQIEVQLTQYVEPVTTTNNDNPFADDNLDTLEDILERTPEERDAARDACINSDPPGRWVIVGTDGRCLGNESDASDDNTVNTSDVIDDYIVANDLSEAEALALQQRYNQFIGTQEPDDLTDEDIAAILDDYDASDVVFVVSPITEGIGTELTGYETQQRAICQQLTGSDNFVVEPTYSACLVE